MGVDMVLAGLGFAGLGLATWSRAAVLALGLSLIAPSVARAADDKPIVILEAIPLSTR